MSESTVIEPYGAIIVQSIPNFGIAVWAYCSRTANPLASINIHTLRVHYAHAAANLNSGYSKYAKVARVHYFCTIALRTSRAVLTRA